MGFEPTVAVNTTSGFKLGAMDHSTTSLVRGTEIGRAAGFCKANKRLQFVEQLLVDSTEAAV